MQNRVFQSYAKFVFGKNQKTNLVHLYTHLVETFPLILNSKIVFKRLFWLNLSILKNALHALNQLTPGGNKRSHILKHNPTPLSCSFI